MRKYRLKEIKNLVALGMAEDITAMSFSECNEFRKAHNLDKVGYSTGVYGINGGLLQDIETGDYYAITARNTTLAQMF
jgi:hypothetical protein